MMKLYLVTCSGMPAPGFKETTTSKLVLSNAAHGATALAAKAHSEGGATVERTTCHELIGAEERVLDIQGLFELADDEA